MYLSLRHSIPNCLNYEISQVHDMPPVDSIVFVPPGVLVGKLSFLPNNPWLGSLCINLPMLTPQAEAAPLYRGGELCTPPPPMAVTAVVAVAGGGPVPFWGL